MNAPGLLFDGRISRARFWLVLLSGLATLTVIGILSFVTTFSDREPSLTGWILMVLVWIGWILLLAVSARRLHDLNASARWLLLLYGAPYGIGVLVHDGSPIASASRLAIVIAVVVLGIPPGSVGPNRFGPDPLARYRAHVESLRW
jgi:uncharacterized membrane protein YhaH (DUF805 family)